VRRRQVLNALRHGAVPETGLDLLAVGMQRFSATVDDDLRAIRSGGAVFKAVRGDYGSGKTFFSRWLAERARASHFATAEVQISENETPLHHLETVYRRLTERLATVAYPPSAFRPIVDSWFYALEHDVTQTGVTGPGPAFDTAVEALLNQRLASVNLRAPMFAMALRAYRTAMAAGRLADADAIMAWLGGQPHVAASARAGLRGDIDNRTAWTFVQGLLDILKDSGYHGLLLVLDEVETLQRARADVREKALNGLRQLVDELDAGRFPGLYMVITGTPAFFDGNQGVQRLPPLAQRLATDFATDARFDNPRAVQVRLPGFGIDGLTELGRNVRTLYVEVSKSQDRIEHLVDDGYLTDLAHAVSGRLGGQVGVAPRVYLKKLVADVLDRVDQFPDFDPRKHYRLTLRGDELTEVERNAASADEVPLHVSY
jgi:hypothetical protein